MSIIDEIESNVKSYCRCFPDVFTTAHGATIQAESGKTYIDFFTGAGVINYGHSNDFIKEKVIAYLEENGIIHGLDMYTAAKERFLLRFKETILDTRNLPYKVQFCGPTGTNAVEASLRLAMKAKCRNTVFSFMGAYHGMTRGSVAATGRVRYREHIHVSLDGIQVMPYPYGFMKNFDTIDYIDAVLNDEYSGITKPAAILFETVQAEGGVIVAPVDWIRRLKALCEKHDILLICDDIQVGCHRTGPFFSFERAGIVPDIVLLSKAISGYGFPMSLVLIKPEYDVWNPAEFTGTFRGNQIAFVSAHAALQFISDYDMEKNVKKKEGFLRDYLLKEIATIHEDISISGIGMIWGIDLSKLNPNGLSRTVSELCFKRGLLIECAGRDDTVLKIMPPLVIEEELLQNGCEVLKQSIVSAVG